MSVQVNAPKLSYDANFVVDQASAFDESFRGDYVGGPDLIYEGFARPGADEGMPVWQISKMTYDANHNITSVKWAQDANGIATSAYIFIWANRAALTYS